MRGGRRGFSRIFADLRGIGADGPPNGLRGFPRICAETFQSHKIFPLVVLDTFLSHKIFPLVVLETFQSHKMLPLVVLETF